MTALDVISLSRAKDWLEIDQSYTLDDQKVTDAILSAVNWIETYTNYRLYEREIQIDSDGCRIEVYDYPVTIISVVNDNGDDVSYNSTKRANKLVINAPKGSLITLNVGYDHVTLIPQQLLAGVRKLIVYLFENRDCFEMTLPVDVQGLVNQYRRGLF